MTYRFLGTTIHFPSYKYLVPHQPETKKRLIQFFWTISPNDPCRQITCRALHIFRTPYVCMQQRD